MVQTWSLRINVYSSEDSRYRGATRYIEFTAKSNKVAKAKVLDIAKKSAARLRKKNVAFFIQAAPYVFERNGRRVLDGNRILRNKLRYSNKNILRVVNPDVAFVQGYGPKALDRL